MTRARAANAIVGNKLKGGPFDRYRRVEVVSGTTGGSAKVGVVYVDASTAGITSGNVWIAVDTSGTGTKINA